MSFLSKLDKSAQEIFTRFAVIEDPKSEKEFFDYEVENKKYKISSKQSFLRARKWYGRLTFLLVWLWLSTVMYIVISIGIGRLLWTNVPFKLDEYVTITLITTTTAGVLVSLNTIIQNLFPIPKSGNNNNG